MSNRRKAPGDSPLLRISIPWMIEVVDALDALDSMNELPNNFDKIARIWNAKAKLEAVFADSIYRHHIRVSAEKAIELHGLLDSICKAENFLERDLLPHEIVMIAEKKKEFKGIFIAELGTMPVYMVSEKECYSIDKLTMDGASLFPPTLAAKTPEAKFDANEVGKALAFELATSCGFHIFRVMEAVARRYWTEVTNGSPFPTPETLGKFADELDKRKSGDAKIIESMKQVTKLHRNPLIHPEVILSVGEAIETLGIARSVIGAMLAVLPDVPQTTGAVSSQTTP